MRNSLLNCKLLRVICLGLSLAALAALLSLSTSCARAVVRRSPLIEQILIPRLGHGAKLTNSACLKYEGQRCSNLEILDYDLADTGLRKSLNDFGFICSVGGKRFKICLDKPGFCRREFSQRCFLGICGKRRLKAETYVEAREDSMLASDTRCYNEAKYEGLLP